MSIWLYAPVNPEPWAVGPLSLGRKGGKMYPRMERNTRLHAYQEEIRECFVNCPKLPEGEYRLIFYFWRQLESYRTESGRQATRNQADATNMQKALEDALQGVLFDNDRNVREVSSLIVDQGSDVKPFIVIKASTFVGPISSLELLPDYIQDELNKSAEYISDNNDWPLS